MTHFAIHQLLQPGSTLSQKMSQCPNVLLLGAVANEKLVLVCTRIMHGLHIV